METPKTSPNSLSRSPTFFSDHQKKLHQLLSLLFFHILPSVLLGILGILLDETARVINKIAAICHAVNPTNRQQPQTIIIQTQTPPLSPVSTVIPHHHHSNLNQDEHNQIQLLQSNDTQILTNSRILRKRPPPPPYHIAVKNSVTTIPTYREQMLPNEQVVTQSDFNQQQVQPDSIPTVSSLQLSPSIENISTTSKVNHNQLSSPVMIKQSKIVSVSRAGSTLSSVTQDPRDNNASANDINSLKDTKIMARKHSDNILRKTGISIGSSLSPPGSLNIIIHEPSESGSIQGSEKHVKQNITEEKIEDYEKETDPVAYVRRLDDAVTQLGEIDDQDTKKEHEAPFDEHNNTLIIEEGTLEELDDETNSSTRDDLFSVPDPPKSLRLESLKKSQIVSKRIKDYEKYLAQTGTELDRSIPTPVLVTDSAMEKKNYRDVPPLQLDGGKMRARMKSWRSNSSVDSRNSAPQERRGSNDLKPVRERSASLTTRIPSHKSDETDWSRLDIKEKRRMLDGGRSGDVHNLFPSSSENNSEKTETDHSHLSTSDAPHAVESLRELIPTNFQENRFHNSAFHKVDEEEEAVVVQVESAEKLSGADSPLFGSSASIHTESYSSPDSPVQYPHRRNQKNSWLASDHDLFSEEPLEMDNSEARRGGLGIDDGDISDMELPNNNAPFLIPENNSVGEYETSSDDIFEDVSSPITKSVERSSWQNEFSSSRSEAKKRTGKSRKPKAEIVDDDLFHQNSYAITSSEKTFDDRPRKDYDGESRVERLAFSRSVSKKAEEGKPKVRNLRTRVVGRSMSSNENHFSDWPEYKPSPSYEESANISRRHVSDMSFGIKARKKNMLPRDFYNQDQDQDDDDYLPIEEDATDQEDGGRLKKLFSRSIKPKEEHDMRTRVMRFLRLHRRSSTPVPGFRIGETSKSSDDRSHRRSGSIEAEIRFECDLDQENLFTLLDQLCSEVNYSMISKRHAHKLKFSVSLDDYSKPLIVSATLSRTHSPTKTAVIIARSKDDQSGAIHADLETVGRRLKDRLASHEYIEDSFASFWLDDSEIDFRDNNVEHELD